MAKRKLSEEIQRDANLSPKGAPQEPQFHRFTELPIELRYMVYNEYFERDHESETGFGWIRHYGPRVSPGYGNGHSLNPPFLPNLCLTDRFIGEEASTHLFNVAVVALDRTRAIDHFVRRLDAHTVFDIASKIRNLHFSLGNNRSEFGVHPAGKGRGGAQYVSELCHGFNDALEGLLPRLTQLRES